MTNEKFNRGDKIKFQIGTGQWSISHGTYLHPVSDLKGGSGAMSMILTAVRRRMMVPTADIWHWVPEPK